MKLIQLTLADAQYFLTAPEIRMLHGILRKFPFTRRFPARISRNRRDPQSAERRQLLNHALAEHRRQLKSAARNLISAKKIQPHANGVMLKLSSEERETLLQVLNDVHVGCWEALGKPDDHHLMPTAGMSPREKTWYGLMHLTSFFETGLLDDEAGNDGETAG